jgi:hypothetical protein
MTAGPSRGKSLAPLISFSTRADGSVTPVFDQAGLDPLLTKLAKQVNRSAQDAGLRLMNGRVIATGSSHEGRTLKAAGMRTALLTEITGPPGRGRATAGSPPS